MSKLTQLGTLSIGALMLFGASFVVFAALSGVPLTEVAVLNKIVKPTAEPGEAPAVGPAEAAAPHRSDAEVVEASAGVLGAFLLEAPFSAEELGGLQRELKGKLRDVEQRGIDLRERERLVREREDALASRWEELMNLRSALDDFEAELHAHAQELERDASAHRERERLSWKKLAIAFQDGEPAELIPRLLQYPPADAARILDALEDERASELLRAFAPDRSFEYWEAYRKHRDEP